MEKEIENGIEIPTEKTQKQSFWELVRFALVAIAIVIPIRLFVAQPFIVSGTSMVPTFEDKQYLIVDEISYELGSPKRDDVVVFKYPNDTTKFFIKRVIGLPGETVDVTGNEVTITNKDHPKGFKLDQPFAGSLGQKDAHVVLQDNEYFTMGDNRLASFDSRYWGPVQKKLFIGRVLFRLYPFNKISMLPGSFKQAE